MILNLHDKFCIESASTYLDSLVASNNPRTRIGLTSGCWDLFHFFHLHSLERCKNLCDVLIVGVDSDSLVKSTKGPERPIVSEQYRMAIIDALKIVDISFLMHSLTDFEFVVKHMHVNYIFKNENFKEEEVVGREVAEVVIIPDTQIIQSTTGYIKYVQGLKNVHK